MFGTALAPRSLCKQCASRLVQSNKHSLASSAFSGNSRLYGNRISAGRWIQSRTSPTGASPPDRPSSLPNVSPTINNTTPAKPFRRTIRFLRRKVWLAVLVGSAYLADQELNASGLTRSIRTFATGLYVGLDYKINFRAHPPFANSIEDVHKRNAERLFEVLRINGGLYLKIGQAIAMQSAILPPEFQKMFARMFDDAPQNDWSDAERVIREDFGKSPEEVFGVSFDGQADKGVMEKTARASASVAQVHWARLGDGREVAVKIQKREIASQVGWDLWAFKVVAKFYSWWFDIPIYTLVPYITERLMLECDFENEASNSERMRELVEGEPRLRGKVYIPKVYRDLSSKRVMTAEWIEGVRLWDKEGITAPWEGGKGKGTPGCQRPLDPPNQTRVAETVHNGATEEKSKPSRDAWKGEHGKGGLGLSMSSVMTTIVDLFSAQMFLWGFVHCDPHPGNVFIRRQPNGKAEVVLIDHGLYISMSPKFRHEYATFWKSLMTFDNNKIREIVSGWGIGAPDLFASATLMRPYTGGDQSTSNKIREGLKGKSEAERAYEMQQKMRDGIRQILGDENKWPKELIFLGRNLRIVQGNNQFLGSPVNRLKITGNWASRALVDSPDLPFRERAVNFGHHLIFKIVLFTSDLIFYFTKAQQYLGIGGGMEDEIEKQMKHMAKDFGVDLNHGVFEG